MKIIYLSADMTQYHGAYYQQETINALKQVHQIYQYGPRCEGYDESDTIADVISKSPFEADLVMIGHNWLYDGTGMPVDVHPAIRPAASPIPVVGILNKEYTNIDEKLEYFREAKVRMLFSHHHEVDFYAEKAECPVYYWPFAIDASKFYDRDLPKAYDFGFIGTLNKYWQPGIQSDARQRIQRRVFYSIGDFRIIPKLKHRNRKIFWRGHTHVPWVKRANNLLKRNFRVAEEDYPRLIAQSKIWLSTLSPIGIIGPRYFDSMASKALVFCVESELYDGLFEAGKHVVTFKDDLSDFDELLTYYLENDQQRQTIVETAYEHVMSTHTWKHRVDFVSARLNEILT